MHGRALNIRLRGEQLVLAVAADVHLVLRRDVVRVPVPPVQRGGVRCEPVHADEPVHLHCWAAEERLQQQPVVLWGAGAVLCLLRCAQLPPVGLIAVTAMMCGGYPSRPCVSGEKVSFFPLPFIFSIFFFGQSLWFWYKLINEQM